jgi:Ca-activated chloride channel family protein
MKKAVWLGLTAVLGALAVGGLLSLTPSLLRARMPAPHTEARDIFRPPEGGEIELPAPEPGKGASAMAEVPDLPPSAPPVATSPVSGQAGRQERDLRPSVAAEARKQAPGAEAGRRKSGVMGVAPAPATLARDLRGDMAAQVAGTPSSSNVATFELKDEESFRVPNPPVDREAYDHIQDNPFLAALTNPLSTFSIDVDTASYSNVRRFLTSGQLPPRDAVRIEELVNYFRYDYPEPEGDQPFSITTEVGAGPWAPEHRLVLVGLRGRSLDDASLPPRNLTFLLDVSGSMGSPDKLPLLKRAMGLLVDTLREEDRVSIVVYAGASGLVLPPTSGARRGEILAALNHLRAGGSTAGGAGIELAYRVAGDSFIDGGINRVILATDGDFNVGISSEGALVDLIEEKRESGVFLSVLGFGQGNLQDSKMEKLADHGNGNYAYIDSLREARKVLVSEAGSTLVTIARDVKIQVEFNPARVKAYRLIGYENRALRAEDFADDRKDAGEIGAGHTVTALYEIVPVGVEIDLPAVDPLKYQSAGSVDAAASSELMTVKLRHKHADGGPSRLTSVVVEDRLDDAPSADLRFSSAVAEFGMLLRESEHRGSASWDQVLDLARGAVGHDPEGHRTEFLVLARSAQQLSTIRQVAITR